MVAIFTGRGSGLEFGSGRVIGAAGVIGSAAQGRSGERVLVNAGTGNLIINQRDEFVVGRGPDLAVERTYNALGDLSDDNGDNWRLSTERYVEWAPGLGNVVRRAAGDGSSTLYTWDVQSSAYIAHDPTGPLDTLVRVGDDWLWTDGETQVTERYAAPYGARWRIVAQSDTDGNALSFAYTGAQLTGVTTADGGWVRYGWSGSTLVELATGFENEDQGQVSLTRVRYRYDAAGRLETVVVDLTPEDGSIDDGQVYVTTYRYQANSKLVSSIVQTDGSRVDFTYDARSRVTGVVQWLQDGSSRTTTLAYSSDAHLGGLGSTTVTDPAGQATRIEYDGGCLTRIVAPPARPGEAGTATRFLYSGSNWWTMQFGGIADPLGNTTSIGVDARGNREIETSIPSYRTIRRTFGARNEVLTERQAGLAGQQYVEVEVTRFVYDAELHLRYRIDAEGGVTEYRYDSNGALTHTIEYVEQWFDIAALGETVAPGEAQVDAWRDGLADRSSVRITSNRYDVRGNLIATIRHAAATVAGEPIDSATDIRTAYAYDAHGRLLARASSGERGEAYAYDGLGRVVVSADGGGNQLRFAFLDEQLRTVVTHAGGRVQNTVHDSLGHVLVATETDVAETLSSITSHRYDRLGRLRTTIDPDGSKRHLLHDAAGRLIAEISALGEMTEHRYDAAGRQVATARYGGRVSAAALAALDDPHTPTDPAQIRPSATIDDIWSWTIYEGARVLQTVDGNGYVTHYLYDRADRLIETRRHTAALSQATLDAWKIVPPMLRADLPADAAYVAARAFFDRTGRQTATLDGEGYLTTFRYDAVGQKIEEIAHATVVPANLRESAGLGAIRSSVPASDADRRSRYAYDGLGQLRYAIDAGDQVVEYRYDGAGRQTAAIEYGAIAGMPSGLDAIEAALVQLGAASWTGIRERWSVYDAAGRLGFAIAPGGAVIGYRYDELGRVVRTTAYANAFDSDTLPHPGVIGEWADEQQGHPENRVTRSFYNLRDEAIYVVDAEGYVTGNSYDFRGNIVRVRSWAGQATVDDETTVDTLEAGLGTSWTELRYAYDRQGRLGDSWDGEGIRRHFDYNPDGTVRMETVAAGTEDEVRTRFDYDGAGRLIARFDADGTADQAVTRFALDAFGNVLATTDPRGAITRRSYDKRNRLLSETNALGGVTSYEYDRFDGAIRITDALGNITRKSYDRLAHLVAVRDAEDYLTENRYSMFGDLIEVIRRYARGGAPHAQDAVTQMSYDRLGRLATLTDAENGLQSIGRNVFGEEISRYNGIGWLDFTGYDRRGLVAWRTKMVPSFDSDGEQVAASVVTRFAYDERGNRAQMIEAQYLPEQRTTDYVYDKANRLIESRTSAVDILSADHSALTRERPVRRFRYDARGNLLETIDPNGARRQSYYDRRDRKIVEIDAVGTYSAWTYDGNGNLLTTRVYEDQLFLPVTIPGAGVPPPPAPGDTDHLPPAAPGGPSRLTTHGYDQLNRLVTTRVAGVRTGRWDGSYGTTVGDVTTTRAYDAAGNLVRTIDGNGKPTWSYFDRLGRKVAEVDRELYLTTWLRDAEGNVLIERRYATRLGAAPGSVAPTVGTSADDRETVFTYDRAGRRLSETRKGVIAWTIGATGVRAAAASDSTVRYAYNALGKVIRRTEANGDTVDYTYDMGGRLVQETRAAFTGMDGVSVSPTVRYLYNAHGDLALTRQGGATAAATDRVTQYIYNPGGQLFGMIDAASGPTFYYYDLAGNVLSQTYVRQKSDGSQVSEGILYRRDLLGRVTSQTTGSWTGSSWIHSDSQETDYDAFGQAVMTGVNGLRQMRFDYDAAGRLWRSTEDDGVWRYYLYDAEGNRTLAIESEGADLADKTIEQVLAIATGNGAHAIGAALVDGINAAISVYDARGQLTQTRLPKRELTLDTAAVDLAASRGYNAFGELAYDVDVRGGRTDYSYSTMGRTLSIQRPTVAITLENGTPVSMRPTELYFYDIAGRLVGVQDANGAVNTRLLLAGSGHGGKDAIVTAEFHPDGGVLRYRHDVFGDLRTTTDEIGRVTTMRYDGMGRLVETVRGSRSDYYAYDTLGRRLKHWTGALGATVFEATDYDVQGRVVRTMAMGGDVTTISFAWSSTLVTAGMGTFGGWVSTTTYANGRQLVEHTDFFGRDLYRKDLGGHEYGFSYDLAGRMVERSVAAEDTFAYHHFNTGRVAQISTIGKTIASNVFNDRLTTYGYDASGNLTQEKYAENSRMQVLVIGGTAPAVRRDYRNMSAAYDALGRLTSLVEAGSADLPKATIDYAYDAVGNVRRVRSQHHRIEATGAAQGALTTTDVWYRYDSMNRVVVSQGRLGSVINRGLAGIDLLYDAAGQRIQAIRDVNQVAHAERYEYDVQGDLTKVFIDIGNDVERRRAEYTYDAFGRVTLQKDYDTNGITVVHSREVSYNAKGQIAAEAVTSLQSEVTYRAENTYHYGEGSLYALGAVVAVTTQNKRNNAVQPASKTINEFDWYGGAVQKVTSYWADVNGAVSTTTYAANAWGQITSARIEDGRPRTVTFVNDMSGEVIRRDEQDAKASGDPHEVWYRFAGQQHGYSGNNGTFETSYQESIANRMKPVGSGPFRLGSNDSVAYANFDQNYAPITSYEQGSSGGSYTVQSGDTLQSIAAQLWGDAALWYELAEANGMSASVGLIEGQQLVVPGGVRRSSNTASTFNPYDPLEALGDTSPTTPRPRAGSKKKKCGGVLGTIIMVVIAVVVTLVTKGAATPYFASLGATGGAAAAGAVGGAVGSIASQGFGMAVGLQDRFSWKGVALAAVGGGVSGGLEKGLVGTQLEGAVLGNEFAGNFVRGAMDNGMTQGIGVVTGLQDRFDWAGAAAAGVGAAMGTAVGGEISGSIGSTYTSETGAWMVRSSPTIGNRLASGAAELIGEAAVHSLAKGTSFGDTILAALPSVIGKTLGAAIGDRLVGKNDRTVKLGRTDLDLGESRGLTDDEKSKISKQTFGDSIDHEAVRIVRGSGSNIAAYVAFNFLDDFEALTWGSTIYMRDDKYRQEYSEYYEDTETLAHELTHTWQYIRLGLAPVIGGIVVEAGLHGNLAAYNPRGGSTTFFNQTFEAQARIVGQYVASKNHLTRVPYDHINRMRGSTLYGL